MTTLDYIRVVLVETTHSGNIGAVARAMANMGVSRLTLVQPRDFPSAQATARAAGADWILDEAVVVDDLDQAIADCALVIGASARLRRIEWPQLSPKQAMQQAAQTARGTHATQAAHTALLFGRESRGLSNRELDRCHNLVHIPANPQFPSLNIASAVMVLLYELRGVVDLEDGGGLGEEVATGEQPALAEDLRHFHQHLQRLLTLLEFGQGSSVKLQRRLIRLFNRARPHAEEIRMLRGIFTAVEKKIRPGAH